MLSKDFFNFLTKNFVSIGITRIASDIRHFR